MTCLRGRPGYFDSLAVDREQARDVARWRKADRGRTARLALSVAERKEIGEPLAGICGRY